MSLLIDQFNYSQTDDCQKKVREAMLSAALTYIIDVNSSQDKKNLCREIIYNPDTWKARFAAAVVTQSQVANLIDPGGLTAQNLTDIILLQNVQAVLNSIASSLV